MILFSGATAAQVDTAPPSAFRPQIWDPPAIKVFPRHDEVVSGYVSLEDLIAAGRELFLVSFNQRDGAGRPAATGDSKPTIRQIGRAPQFQRVAGPDANSCAGCHNRPVNGGAGDFAANVFVGAHFTDPPTLSIDPAVTNERNTIGLFGAGAIEALAREMTEELQARRQAALLQARAEGRPARVPLHSKGVSFGHLTAYPDGTYGAEEIAGVDMDLVVKPFGAKGVAVSIREFTIFALNQHHGIQSEERFGWARTGVKDFDGDGVETEFTVGQLTALTVYQAILPAPRRTHFPDLERAKLASLGERRFSEIGCGGCHRPRLLLRSSWLLEPNPFNRPGSAIPDDVGGQILIPIPVEPGTGIFKGEDGLVYAAAYTDLKRHIICDDDDAHFCNETLRQDFVPTNQFLTAKLWDAGSSAPYGHRGDLTSLSEAIVHHSGEAKSAKRAFLQLPDREKLAVILFLQSLRVELNQEVSTERR